MAHFFSSRDSVEACIDEASRITATELSSLLDAKLVDPRTTAVRFYALSLALNQPTDRQLYDALIKYDCHPELVSVVHQMEKSYVVETASLVKPYKKSPFDKALLAAAAAGKLKVMNLLFELGAKRKTLALFEAARKGQLEAMELLQKRGAGEYDVALEIAAEEDQLEAMELLKKWGDSNFNFNAAFKRAARKNRLNAMTRLKEWGATKVDRALAYAAHGGSLDAMNLLAHWGADDFDGALAEAAACGQIEAMELLKKLGAKDFERAIVWTRVSILRDKSAPIALLEEWISARG